MKNFFYFIFLLPLFLVSCGSSKKVSKSHTKTHKTVTKSTSSTNKTANRIIKNAKTFEGTRYKFGGTTKRGMDCSGLVYVAFGKEGIKLPRVSRDMANKGKAIPLKKVKKGDLLFFITNKSRKRINHVGIVTKVSKGQIHFIHTSTSRGVTNSTMDEPYWKKAFVKARRIL